MTAWITVWAVGVGTLLLRGSFVVFMGDRELPPALTSALRFVPASVLTALVVPAVVLTERGFDLTPDNHRWPAAIVAAGVAHKTRNIAYTILAGMVALWIARAIL